MKLQAIAFDTVLGVVIEYEIDFGRHCRAGVNITDNTPIIVAAMNGWGEGISLDEIKIKKT